GREKAGRPLDQQRRARAGRDRAGWYAAGSPRARLCGDQRYHVRRRALAHRYRRKGGGMIRAAVFASGNGTNADNILRFARGHADRLHIAAVICNVEGAGVITRAQSYGVPCHVLPVTRASFGSFKTARLAQEDRIRAVLDDYGVEWAFLAGYM